MEKPLFLLLLLLIPLLVWLHSLRGRRREVAVPSLVIWRRLLRNSGRSLRFRRFLRNLALLLQILVVVALTLALTDPFLLKRSAPYPPHIILIMDTTASMKTKLGSGSRFEEAKRMAVRAVNELPEATRVTVISAGSKPALVAPYSDDKNRVGGLIQQLEATDAAGYLREAVFLGLSFANREETTEIWLFSDGADDSPKDLELNETGVRLFQAGRQARNTGITKFQFRRRLDRPELYEILVQLTSYHAVVDEVPLELLVGGRSIYRETIYLEPFDERILIVPYEGLRADRAVVELKKTDDFSVDDRGYVVLTGSREIQVLLVGPGNYFLESVLSAFPNLHLTVKEHYTSGAEYDIIVFDRVSSPPLDFGNFILIDTLAPNLPWEIGGYLDNPVVSSWQKSHPVLRHLTLDDLAIRRIKRITGVKENQILCRAGNHPVMAVYEQQNIRVLYLGFNLLESDFPLRVSFPILIGNVLAWLSPGALASPTNQIRAGETFSFPIREGIRQISVVKPNGDVDQIEAPENPIHYSNTSTVGFYSVLGAAALDQFAVNLLSKSESDIQPRYQPPARGDGGRSEEPGFAGRTKNYLWPVLVVVALLLVPAEWFLWMRKW